jgi:hypothetical protein
MNIYVYIYIYIYIYIFIVLTGMWVRQWSVYRIMVGLARSSIVAKEYAANHEFYWQTS